MTKPFYYDSNKDLWVERLRLCDVVKQTGTPLYLYSQKTLIEAFQSYRQAFRPPLWSIHYAMKANAHQAIIRVLQQQGAGCDVVSEGEIRRALHARIDPAHIVFSGVGKTVSEIDFAIGENIGRFNIESETELDIIAERATLMGKKPRLSIRVNPDIDAGTDGKISTGRKSDKFGIAYDRVPALYRKARGMASVDMTGLAVHIGSQIQTLDPFEKAFQRLAALIVDLKRAAFIVHHIDIGGGRAIPYQEDMVIFALADYAALAEKYFTPFNVSLALEPGRSLVAEAGIMLTELICIKQQGDSIVAIVDAGMNDFMRPALYGTEHAIHPLHGREEGKKIPQDIVGPVCESTDYFARNCLLAPLKRGDHIILSDAGAYGMVMRSDYNARARAMEVLVSGDRWAEITPRGDLDAFKTLEAVPSWVK